MNKCANRVPGRGLTPTYRTYLPSHRWCFDPKTPTTFEFLVDHAAAPRWTSTGHPVNIRGSPSYYMPGRPCTTGICPMHETHTGGS